MSPHSYRVCESPRHLSLRQEHRAGANGQNAGMDLAYDVKGRGPALLFIHAGIADRRMWHSQLDHFAGRYQCVAYDMRGFGESPLPKGKYSPRQDIVDLLDHLGIEKATVVGCSMGGSTALEFAIEHPERVERLVLVNSGAPGRVPEGGYYEPPGWDDAVAAFKAGDFEAFADFDVELWVVGPHRDASAVDPDLRALVREMNLVALRQEEQRESLTEMLDPPAGKRLDEVSAPTLVMVSELDVPDMGPLGDLLVDGIEGAMRLNLPEVAHLPSLEDPVAFNTALGRFLENDR